MKQGKKKKEYISNENMNKYGFPYKIRTLVHGVIARNLHLILQIKHWILQLKLSEIVVFELKKHGFQTRLA